MFLAVLVLKKGANDAPGPRLPPRVGKVSFVVGVVRYADVNVQETNLTGRSTPAEAFSSDG